jgi:hypothetical protein
VILMSDDSAIGVCLDLQIGVSTTDTSNPSQALKIDLDLRNQRKTLNCALRLFRCKKTLYADHGNAKQLSAHFTKGILHLTTVLKELDDFESQYPKDSGHYYHLKGNIQCAMDRVI